LHDAGDQFGEGAGFLKRVDGVDGDVDVEAIAAGGLGVAGESDRVEDVFDHQGGIDDQVEGAFHGVEINQDEVGVVEVGDAG
jgi:hypothetical protein